MKRYWLLGGLILTSILNSIAEAGLAPSTPEPGTVWKVGEENEIIWEEDGVKPTIKQGWQNFKIDLMTGDNMDQKFLTNVATNVSGSGPMSLKWKTPDVEPHAPIYFLMFTNENGDNAWTTRFAIVGENGKMEKPIHATQPNGDKIPWGVGKLVEKPKQDEKTDTVVVHEAVNPVSSSSAPAAETSAVSAPEPSVLANVHLAINNNENAPKSAGHHHLVHSSLFVLAGILALTLGSML